MSFTLKSVGPVDNKINLCRSHKSGSIFLLSNFQDTDNHGSAA